MSKALQWILGLCAVLLVAALVFSVVAPYFLPARAVTAYGGMMGPEHWGMMGRGLNPGHMLGGFGVRAPFFGLAGLGMLAVPLLLIGLVVLGLAALLRRNPPAAAPLPPAPVATVPCAHCGQPLQPGWKACPNCGEKV